MTQNTSKQLTPRRLPKQERAVKRTQQIMDVTTVLLDRVGFDELTTILITKELGISVGSLYHYFPNKHAILRAITENWLKEWDKLMGQLVLLPVEELALETVVESLNKRFYTVYKEQQGILPLVDAMYCVPELRDLDEQHDKKVSIRISAILERMGFNQPSKERERIARCYLEIVHAMLMMVLQQKGADSKRTLDDLNRVSLQLLIAYK